jgi:hypothetical protein
VGSAIEKVTLQPPLWRENAAILSPKTGLHDLVPKPFGDQPSLAPLLQSCFADLTELDGDGDTAMTTPLVQALAQLALIDRGVVTPTSHAALAAFRSATCTSCLRRPARASRKPSPPGGSSQAAAC